MRYKVVRCRRCGRASVAHDTAKSKRCPYCDYTCTLSKSLVVATGLSALQAQAMASALNRSPEPGPPPGRRGRRQGPA